MSESYVVETVNAVTIDLGEDPPTATIDLANSLTLEIAPFGNATVPQVDAVFAQSRTVSVVFNADGSVTETLEGGITRTTTFSDDGSIVRTLSGSVAAEITTTFNSDGSITETAA